MQKMQKMQETLKKDEQEDVETKSTMMDVESEHQKFYDASSRETVNPDG